MEVSVYPSAARGTVSATSSKSVLQRYMAGAFAPDDWARYGISHCADTLACLSAVQSLGAKFESGKGIHYI